MNESFVLEVGDHVVMKCGEMGPFGGGVFFVNGFFNEFFILF